jgi:signal transduction histidine kinase
MNRLFQRFQQLDASTTRRVPGLGLAITKALVEEHGGRIAVTSIEGEGSTFSFIVPAAEMSVAVQP